MGVIYWGKDMYTRGVPGGRRRMIASDCIKTGENRVVAGLRSGVRLG